ncbi:MAG: hypothetical protein HQ541_04450, partial [Mariniphaga sp.]|nr:hypothetical protein [Mariniphaga sp.]
MKKCVLLGILFLSATYVFAQTEKEKGLAEITDSAIKGQLEFLASDWTEGRETGTKGAYLAADYIASMFKVYGVEPFGDTDMIMPSREERRAGVRPTVFNTYFQNFSLIKYTPGSENELAVSSKNADSKKSIHYTYQTDYSVNTGSVALSANAPVVFAGYGLTDEDNNYDDLNKLDVEGKIVVIISGFPGYKDTASEAFKKFRPLRSNPMVRRSRTSRFGNLEEKGAIAVIQAGYEA